MTNDYPSFRQPPFSIEAQVSNVISMAYLQVAWDNHPRRAVVTNDFPSFNGKVAAATDHVLDLINAAK